MTANLAETVTRVRPGQLILSDTPITINAEMETVEITVENTSKQVVFVGSHYPFFEVNSRLRFDRAKAWGLRLDLAAGDCVGWLPGESKTVQLVPFGGRRILRGFNGLTEGSLRESRRRGALERVRQQGFSNVETEEGSD
jgi:urease beta subunit